MEADIMVNLHPQIIRQDGKKEYAVLPYEEFLKLQERLQDYEDLRSLREAKEAEKDEPTIGIDELKKKIGARTNRTRRRTKTRG
jgi:hypothetical protein